MKTCRICRQELSDNKFYFRKDTKKFVTECKNCYKLRTNSDKVKLRRKEREHLHKKGRKLQLKKLYNITLEQFDILVALQSNKCAICGEELIKPFLDHDHRTNKIRGILCRNCNIAIGLLSDSPVKLINAVRYLVHNGVTEYVG